MGQNEVARLRVVAIEDNPTDVKLLEKHLSELPYGFFLNAFETGDAAIEYLQALSKESQERLPQVIFLDLHLPGDDGFEVLEKIKSIESLKNIPVLVFSGSDESQDIVNTYKRGGVIFLKKSATELSFEDLINQLRISKLIR